MVVYNYKQLMIDATRQREKKMKKKKGIREIHCQSWSD